MTTVMIVEDEYNIRTLTAARLKSHYSLLLAKDGEEALELFYKQHVDLIVADIMMPRMDGYELVRQLREYKNNVPVILLTAKTSFEDKREGFSTGIDDYMTKPVNYEELIWHIDALLRRANISIEKKISFSGLTINGDNYTVSRNDETTELPRKEFELLFKLLSYPDVIFTKDQLLEEIWGMETESQDSTIKTHISRLRNRFETWPEFTIITVRGLGYKAQIN